MFAPTRRDLHDADGARLYCRTRNLSARATDRIVALVTGAKCVDVDWSDHRTLPKEDRVPRSLEGERHTPRGYWDITDP